MSKQFRSLHHLTEPSIAELPASHHQGVTDDEVDTINLIYSQPASHLLATSTVLFNWLKGACIYCLFWGSDAVLATHPLSECQTLVHSSVRAFIRQLAAASRKRVRDTANCWKCLLPDPATYVLLLFTLDIANRPTSINATPIDHQPCTWNSDILLVSLAAVWALPTAPLRTAITNNNPFSTPDEVCDLISKVIPYGSKRKQGLAASLPLLISTILIMAPVPEFIMQEVNKVLVPSTKRMECTDGLRFPTMVHRIGRLESDLDYQSTQITPYQAIPTSPTIPSSSTHQPASAHLHTTALGSPIGGPPSTISTPCNQILKLKLQSSKTIRASQTGAMLKRTSQSAGSSRPRITPISTPKPRKLVVVS